MIDAQLGPPVAVASRGGSAPTGGAGGDNASANRTPADDGGFTAALESRRTPPASSDSDARTAEAHTHTDAAGPQTGELQEEAAADVGASQKEAAAAGLAAAIAAAVTAVVPTVASPTPPAGGALAGQQIAMVVQAAGPPQPIAGLVPALLDGNGGVMPATAAPAAGAQGAPGQAVAGQVLAAMPASTVAVAQVAAATEAPVTTTTPATQSPAVPAPAAPAAQASAATAANAATATVTLTISTPAVVDAGGAADAAAPAQLVSAQATTPVAEALKGQPALRPQVSEAASSMAVATPEPPAGSVGPAPAAAPIQNDPLGGIVRSSGGLTTPHELARELGQRVHMAVREGGRELVVQLRPADLGHLTIRVTMADGVMQATIIADRPEAARMLQQSLGNLDAALGDLGYSLDNLDVAYQGQDPRDAQAPAKRAEEAVTGEVLEADGSPAVSGIQSSSSAGGTAGLDLLA
jgi:flagellar hook-length control protein FliK